MKYKRKEVIGDATLYLADCMDVMPYLEGVDAVICDPPYGTTACKWDEVIPFDKMWAGIKACTKDTTPIVMTASQPFTSALVMSNPKMFKYCWVWNKKRPSNPMLAKKQALKVHEDVTIFYKKLGVYNPQGVFKTDGKPRGGVNPSKTKLGFGKAIKKSYKQTKSGYPKSIIEFGSDNTKNVHPTQKPVALMEYLIKTYTNQGDTVLDFTMGSGTTGVAAIRSGRKFIGIELDEEYFDIACERIRQEYNQMKLF